MEQKKKLKELGIAILLFMFATLAVLLLIKQMTDFIFNPRRWNDLVKIYINDAAPTRWAYFSYYTNISLYIFCFYCFLNLFAVLFDIQKLKNFLKNPYLLMFIAINQFLVFVVYSGMFISYSKALAGYRKLPIFYHRIAASFYKHYFMTLLSVFYCFCHARKQKISFKKCLLFLIFPVVYAIIIEIVGHTCYFVEWYPYPFFAPRAIWAATFRTFSNYNQTYAILMVVASFIAILGVFILAIFLCCLIFNKICDRRADKLQKTA